ncbi:hypothetical protein [Tindallia californiensis]|uniref:Transglutaminase-like superfamily protein n=1 Tax=Tindallia californiensis TaxID=159292 RepID=A0A1H3MVX0_9FIRM|nr:hypothetical protein [Tindallia californiensis]SDY80841.1 hypothetical protein SAMN05192546_104304 [Tindallia californiensis]
MRKKKKGAGRWGRLKHSYIVLVVLAWTLFVLYPNPMKLGLSIYRIFHPPINAVGVAHLLEEIPLEPAEIETYVLREIPYQYDWVTYGMPWYFPTLEEVLDNKTGDCKSRFLVLASLFESQEIPYQLSFSLSHFWVVYEGKAETPLEQAQNAFMLREEDGSLQIQVPREDRNQIWNNFREGFWEYMPFHRKTLLILGWITAVVTMIVRSCCFKKTEEGVRA